MRDAHLMADKGDVTLGDAEIRLVIQMPGPRANPVTTTVTIPEEDWATMDTDGRRRYIEDELRDFILREFEPEAEYQILTDHSLDDPTEES